jgi:tetratricopeptide (TPR) repeat protein
MKFYRSKSVLIFGLFFALVVAATADPEVSQLLSSGHMNEAVSVLSTREDAESLNQLSRAYFAMGQWDTAAKYGERAVNLDPGNATYHLWLGREYGRKAADARPLAAAGLARKAKSEFERAVQLDPTNVQARADLAEYYTEAPAILGGGLDKARDQAAPMQKHHPGTAHLVLARVADKARQYSEAESQFHAAIQTARNRADMWLQLASYYREHGRLDDMQSAVLSAMAVPNKPAETYFDAGNMLYRAGRDFSAAVQYLQSYLSSDGLVESAPAFRAHYLIGQLNERMGQHQAAAAEYTASLALASGFAPAKTALNRIQ